MNPEFTLTLPALVLAMVLSGCITTSTNTQKKWSPEERSQAHVDLGMDYLRKNQLETASDQIEMAIAIFPKSDSAYYAKALLLAQLGRNKEATGFFAKAVSLNSNNFKARNDYGIHLCQQDQVLKGIEQLKRVENTAIQSQSLRTNLGLGVCYFRDKQYHQAEAYLKLALQQSPSLPQALLPLAEIDYEKKDYLHARGFLERLFATGSVSERSLYLASLVELHLEDEDKANIYRRELKRRFPLSTLNNELGILLN